MEWTWAPMILVMIVFAYSIKITWSSKKKVLPPGPRRLPIIGNLYLMAKFTHQGLQELAPQYGPIVYMRLGFVPVVVISSPQAAERILKTHDHVFASRPHLEGAKYITYNRKSVAFSDGPYWRKMRKLCTLEMLCGAKINSFKPMMREEVGILVHDLKKAASIGSAAVDLSARTASLVADMTCRMVFGRKFMDEEIDERGIKAVLHETAALGAAPNISDFIPRLAPLDLQGLRKQYKSSSKVLDDFFEKIIDEHMAPSRREKTKDFVDIMLDIMASQDSEFSIDLTNIIL